MECKEVLTHGLKWMAGIEPSGNEQLNFDCSADMELIKSMQYMPGACIKHNEYKDSIVMVYGLAKHDTDVLNTIGKDMAIMNSKYNVIDLVFISNEDDKIEIYCGTSLQGQGEGKVRVLDKKISSLGVLFDLPNGYKFDSQAVASKIWSCADVLRGALKPHEYGELLLPLVLVKRLADTFEEVRDEFNAAYDKYEGLDNMIRLQSAMDELNITYCITYDGTIRDAINDEYDCTDNLIEYVESFVDRDGTGILAKIFGEDYMDLVSHLRKLESTGYAYTVLSDMFCDGIDLSGSYITASDMGFVFEHIIKKFNDAVGEGAGEHYTAPDIVKVMSEILIGTVDSSEKFLMSAYDMTMGTSQMLTVLNKQFTEHYGDSKELELNGQELNGFTYGIACADALIRGVEPATIEQNFFHGNTLTEDAFEAKKFDYIISNPPFGVNWKAEYRDVLAESEGQFGQNRFSYGLPSKSDGQMLFTCNGLAKLKPNGVMAIVHNGSPLFSGNPGSGEAAIREEIISDDKLLAIIKLPDGMFYNTAITTYIWVVGNKPVEREGKVQLIDAHACCKKLRKAQGSKRNEISDDCRKLILEAYENNTDATYELEGVEGIVCESKVLSNDSFEGEADERGRYKWEIPFDKLFYKAEEQEDSEGIRLRILKLNSKIQSSMEALFGDLNTTKEDK